jgi:putative phosphoribosyl transferase
LQQRSSVKFDMTRIATATGTAPTCVLAVPDAAPGLVILVGDRCVEAVATAHQQHGLATLRLELPTGTELEHDRLDATPRNRAELLADQLVDTLDAIVADGRHGGRPIGLFGSGEGGAAALIAAVRRPERVAAVAGLGAQLDLAGPALVAVRAPTLLIVGSGDMTGMRRHREAARTMVRRPTLAFVSGANQRFEQPGALAEAAAISAGWFLDQFCGELVSAAGPRGMLAVR